MSQELLNLGTVANDRTGDTWRAGGEKINSNFTELYSVTTPLNSKDDVLLNGTLLAGVITLNAGCYSLGIVDLGTDVLRVSGGTSITGCTATFSSIVSSSASPTITFIDGGFNASGLVGSAGVKVNNTSTGAAIRIEGNDTIVFLTNVFSNQSGTIKLKNFVGSYQLLTVTFLVIVTPHHNLTNVFFYCVNDY